MKLHTREWGSGERTAVLVHGIMSDSRTWHRVAPRIAEFGYRVVAVDLRGHGQSPRGSYSPRTWADDLVDTLPPEPDLAIGHSLGAVALALAADRLRPARAVYSDPAWMTVHADPPFDLSMLAGFKEATREQIVAVNPRWDPSDVEVELATLPLWDTATVDGAILIAAADSVPDHPPVPSLAQLASDSLAHFRPAAVEEMRERGLEVRVVPGVGHCIHRDDPDAFLSSLDGWL
ncbi:alpha/beta hydrolase [Streptomyces sp. NPDC051976]|uniref:alpha/beta fold hydrolase n=1 Tax=Streptomyces sp. NPDC051976 TaxID=3154947 RepID=UPI00341E41E9